jgi:DNA-binding response OmpR family regulator
MIETLLVNFDPKLAERLASLLASQGHRISICTGFKALRQLLRKSPGFDLAIVDVSFDTPTAGVQLAELQAYRVQHGPRPMLLCVSRVYRGPQFELELERKGARVAYVR